MNNPTATPENATNGQNNNTDPKAEQKNAATQNPGNARTDEDATETDTQVEDTDTEAAQ